jgi:hypothetical protein
MALKPVPTFKNAPILWTRSGVSYSGVLGRHLVYSVDELEVPSLLL